jgi:hypothetical protein
VTRAGPARAPADDARTSASSGGMVAADRGRHLRRARGRRAVRLARVGSADHRCRRRRPLRRPRRSRARDLQVRFHADRVDGVSGPRGRRVAPLPEARRRDRRHRARPAADRVRRQGARGTRSSCRRSPRAWARPVVPQRPSVRRRGELGDGAARGRALHPPPLAVVGNGGDGLGAGRRRRRHPGVARRALGLRRVRGPAPGSDRRGRRGAGDRHVPTVLLRFVDCFDGGSTGLSMSAVSRDRHGTASSG